MNYELGILYAFFTFAEARPKTAQEYVLCLQRLRARTVKL